MFGLGSNKWWQLGVERTDNFSLPQPVRRYRARDAPNTAYSNLPHPQPLQLPAVAHCMP